MSGFVIGTSISLFDVMYSYLHFIDEEPESQRDVWSLSVLEVWICGLELRLKKLL